MLTNVLPTNTTAMNTLTVSTLREASSARVTVNTRAPEKTVYVTYLFSCFSVSVSFSFSIISFSFSSFCTTLILWFLSHIRNMLFPFPLHYSHSRSHYEPYPIWLFPFLLHYSHSHYESYGYSHSRCIIPIPIMSHMAISIPAALFPFPLWAMAISVPMGFPLPWDFPLPCTPLVYSVLTMLLTIMPDVIVWFSVFLLYYALCLLCMLYFVLSICICFYYFIFLITLIARLIILIAR